MSSRTAAMLLFAGAHFVVLVVYVGLLAGKGAVWHWSYTETVPSVNEVRVVDGALSYRKRSYSRVIAREHTADACSAPSVVTSETWDKPLYSREHDMCVFKQVSAVMDRPSDPRDLSVLASGSPFFLLATMQVLVFSHLYWSASPLASCVLRWPVDLVVACTLPLVWLVIGFALQMDLTVVYNNMLLVVLATSLVVALEVCWTMQSAAGAYDTGDTGEGEPLLPLPPAPASNPLYKPEDLSDPLPLPTVAAAKYPQGRRNTIADRINVSTFLTRPTTRVPLMPLEEQGDVHKNWHTVSGVAEKLANHGLLAVPRLMLLPVALAMVAAAALFAAGSVWRYAEVAMFVLITVMATSMNVPLFVIARTAHENANAKGVSDDRVISGWIFVCVIGILVALFPLLVCVHVLVLLPVFAKYSAVIFVTIVAMYCVVAAVGGCGVLLAGGPKSFVMWEVEVRTVLVSVAGLLVFAL